MKKVTSSAPTTKVKSTSKASSTKETKVEATKEVKVEAQAETTVPPVKTPKAEKEKAPKPVVNFEFIINQATKVVTIAETAESITNENDIYRSWIRAKRAAIKTLRAESRELTINYKTSIKEMMKLKSPKHHARMEAKENGVVSKKDGVTKTKSNPNPIKMELV